MRKILFTIMLIALLACPAIAQRYRGFQIAIVDEFGNAVTNIDQIEIQDVGTSTTSTIYGDRAGAISVTNPITTSSTNSTFDQSLGLVRWYQRNASFKIVVTESGASQSLTRDNLDSTNTRIAWFVDYIGEAATLQTTDSANLDIGTGDDFTHDWDNTNSRYIIRAASDDSGTMHFGQAALHHDIYWHTGAAITSDYVLFDEGSANVQFIDVDLLMDDEAKLLIGDSSDVTIEYDESNNDLDITSTTALDLISFGATGDGYDIEWFSTTSGDYVLFDYSADAILLEDVELFFGDGEGLYFGDALGTGDFKISDETDVLTIDVVAAGVGSIAIGNDADDVPLKWFGETASSYIQLTGDQLQVEASTIALGDGDAILLGDTLGTGDFSISDASDVLLITQVADGTGSVAFSADGEGMDVTFYGDTASSYMLWDENGQTNGSLVFEAADLHMMDADNIIFGDGSDFTVHSTTTKILNFTPAAASDDYQVLLGSDQTGVDLGVYGTTASAYALWDASANALWVEGSDIFLGDSDLLVFGDAIGTGDIKVYATGTDLIIDGVVAETGTVAIGLTDVGLDFKLWAATNAEGVLWDASDEALEFTGANITLDAASILTLGETVNADVLVTTGTYAVLAANSGKVHVIPDLAGNTAINLPAEADGLYYKFIYCGAAAEAHDHTIDSESNTNYYIGGVAFIDSDAGAGADEHSTVSCDGNSNSEIVCNNLENGSVIELHCDGTNWYLTGTVYSDTTPTVADN